MIGTRQDLKNAATGSMPKRGVPETPEPVANDPYKSALERRGSLSQTAAGRLASAAPQTAVGRYTGGLVGDPTAMSRAVVQQTEPTQMYGQLLRGLAAAKGGLSSEGKYGGFYSAEDLRSAIEGAAIGTRQTYVPQLRGEAERYYEALDKMYGEALRPARSSTLASMGFKPSAPASAAGARMFEEVSSDRPAPLREYKGQLGSWYEQQAAPAEEYLTTAQQLETTPLSDLAQRIAVQSYGMNPDLARQNFAGLDAEFFRNRRDQEYTQLYGVPYEEYKALQEEATSEYGDLQERQRTMTERAATQQIENLTGFKASTFGNLIGRTPAQVAETAKQTVTITNPATGQQEELNGAGLIQAAREYAQAGDLGTVRVMYDEAKDQNTNVAALLAALMYMAGYRQESWITNTLDLAGIGQ